jgi:hypothetical protein
VDFPFPAGTGTHPYKLRAADLDGDGKLDLMACEVYGSNVTILHNIATPGSITTNSFEPAFDLPTGNDCRFAIAADLDGDGRVDIVALNVGDNTISILKNIGTLGTLTANSFALQVILTAPSVPYEAVIADLDGDGKPDLAVVEQGTGMVSIYQNLTTPGTITTNSFASRIDLPVPADPETLVAVDLDADGKIDLVAGSPHSTSISVYRNVSAGGLLTTNSFAPRVDFATGDWTHELAIADFNGDGKPDVTVVGELPSLMSVFQNVSTPGAFNVSSLASRVDFGTGWNAQGVAAGDLDGDGRPDIVFCNVYDNTVTIYQNQMPFGVSPVITTQPASQTVKAGQSAAFSVVASGTAPLSYQWFKAGVPLTDSDNVSGSTSDTLTLNNLMGGDAGNYSVIVSNASGSTVSSVATLAVNDPVIGTQPASQAAVQGGSAALSVVTVGTSPLAYQWSFNGSAIAGATNATLTLTNLHLNQAGTYQVAVSNLYGKVTSSNATLSVIPQNILTYVYTGKEKITTAGHEYAYNYTGMLYFDLSSTNGVFIGWANMGGVRQYWVSPFTNYLLTSVQGSKGQVYTLLGKAGEEVDAQGRPGIWSYFHKGLNTMLYLDWNHRISFPATFDCAITKVYPDATTGSMVLREATSTYKFAQQVTLLSNVAGATMWDLVNANEKTLAKQGYQKQ